MATKQLDTTTTQPLPETDDVWTHEDLPADSGSGYSFDFDNSTSEGSGGGDHHYSIDPSILGLPPGGLDLDMGFYEGDLEGSHSAVGSFNQTAQSYLSNTKKRRRPKALAKITEDDFEEGAEQSAYLVIMHFANRLLDKNAKEKHFVEALEWFFTSKDVGDLTFELCCEVLQARPDVIRLRIQYEWWQNAVSFTGPFSFDTCGAPSLMRGEILFHAGQLGFALAREIWVQPGISTKELLFEVGMLEPNYDEAEMIKALETLQERYIISKNLGWFFTGRNPLLMNMRSQSDYGTDMSVGGSVHWSRLFG